MIKGSSEAGTSESSGGVLLEGQPDPRSRRTLSLETLRNAWNHFERRAAEPAARFRVWGRFVAVIALAGSGFGLIRLLLGLWAVGHCRRLGRLVEDPAMLGLVNELRTSMGCRPIIEVREISDLATPATAGWRRPMILLPDDWRAWDESEHRAVIAHELAHIIRGDYAAGLVARLALVIHFYHPLVRWMAARLTLQQELAADALGAQFSGGRTRYLVALSSLALKQDGRSPSWPVRAFLPTRGTLIRRIKMLRDENKMSNGGWPKSLKLATVGGLVLLTGAIASLKSPAQAADEPKAAEATADRKSTVTPFDVRFVFEGKSGVFAFRPAATFQRTGMRILHPWALELVGDGDLIEMLAKHVGIDTKQPGFLSLHAEDVESITTDFDISTMIVDEVAPELKGQKRRIQRIEIGEAGGVTVRMVAAFDWLKFLRQWKVFQLEEVREARGVYYRVKSSILVQAKLNVGIYLPDDRTLVYESEEKIKQLIAREAPAIPAYLKGAAWDRVSRDLLAVAINNHDDVFAKKYDRGVAEDAEFLKFFKGVDHWVVGIADDDRLSIHAEGLSPKAEARAAIVKELKTELKNLSEQLSDEAIEVNLVHGGANLVDLVRLARIFVAKIRVEDRDGSLVIDAEDIVRFPELLKTMKKVYFDEIQKERQSAVKAEAEAKKVKR
jgi:beta-lactamase regulating signal transducer with metallopeptidase domain